MHAGRCGDRANYTRIYYEIMRMVSQSSILESPGPLCVCLSVHTYARLNRYPRTRCGGITSHVHANLSLLQHTYHACITSITHTSDKHARANKSQLQPHRTYILLCTHNSIL